MPTDTTAPSYWLNWRFFLCAVWLLTAMVVSAFVIWKFEGPRKSKTQRRDDQRDTASSLYKDEAWKTSLTTIHPAWLFAYRVTAFSVLLALLVTNAVLDGVGIFYFYTQWTFTLVTVYFGVASSFSIYGCYQCHYKVGGDGVNCITLDTEQVADKTPILEQNANKMDMPKRLNSHEESLRAANALGYVFQIIYQISAGAVTLTDCVFWFIIYPFLTSDDYKLNFLDISLHSLNAIFLLGDVILNCLRFPFFRISYFILWTGIFVVFQWIIHACVSMWWPYSFLDLSSPYAPLWYMAVGFLHLPCYGLFGLVVRTKHSCFSRSFPDAFQLMG